MLKNFYHILGISRQATAEEVKRAYRRMALKYHPDTHGGDNRDGERFKEINEAYSILGDRRKRRDYDLRGTRVLGRSDPPGADSGMCARRPAGSACHAFGRMSTMAGCFSRRGSGSAMAFRVPVSKYHLERGDVVDIQLTQQEARDGAEKVVDVGSSQLRIRTQSHLSDGDFLILKNGHPSHNGTDVYLRVQLKN